MRSLRNTLAYSLVVIPSIINCTSVLAGQPVTLDVMAVYTKNTETNYDMAAKLSQFVNYANKSYKNSKVNIKLRLVHHSALPSSEEFKDTITKPSLKKLKSSEYVAALRAKHGADFVTLIGPASGYCGLGYLPWRNNNGELAISSKSVAYNWVGITCLSAYAHELGHNMGLHHSRAQKNKGAIFDWGLGHGENGLYVTTMAYRSAYGHVPRLPFFSNPDILECKGMACGNNINKTEGTNASLALNRVATRLAEFMPTKYDLINTENINNTTTVNSHNTTANTSANINTKATTKTTITTTTRRVNIDQVCKKTKVAGNLVNNSEFSNSQLQGWYGHNGSLLTIEKVNKSCGNDEALKIINTQENSGAYTKITGIKLDTNYDFTVKVKLDSRNNIRSNVKVLLQTSGHKDITLSSQSVTNREFTQIKATFIVQQNKILTTSDEVKLIIYTPSTDDNSDTKLLLDNVIVKKSTIQSAKPIAKTHQILFNDFENGLQSWHQGFDSKVTITSGSANEGHTSLSVMNRQYWYAGAAYDVRGLLKNNTTYNVKTKFKLTSQSNKIQYADIRLYYFDDEGHHWIPIKYQPISVNQWHTITGTINISPKGTIHYQKLFVFGPDKGLNFNIDNVQLNEMNI